ncbi:ROK family transcriptional regulator [Brachybacterium paraconglomeratum]|uniref:ROK family transcriptional regulator n=1 Tax=Brachybacterium paraconglomeratum TaxID=173362 RepID=UPI0031EEE959
MGTTGERRASATDAAILEIVRRRSETSRVEISRELGVTPATVTYAVKRLLAAGLLREAGFAQSKGGKRASLLRLNDQARWAIGCTIDADRLSLAGVDLTGALRARIAVPLGASPEPAEVGRALHRALTMIRPEGQAHSATGIGLAIPHGFGDHGPELLRELTEGLEIPFISANAPACAALGSFWSGEQPESGLCATVHVDAGLGLAILQHGRPLQPGPSSSATLDHVGIDPEGPPCACGGRGCLHQYASARAIIERASRTGDLAHDLGLRLTGSSLSSDVVLIALAAARGEPRARDVFVAAVSAVAQAVWSATSALGIRAVVLSGPGMQAAPVLVGETMDRLFTARARNLGAEVSVSVSQVQPHPCAVGAAVLALQTFMTPGRASRSEPAGWVFPAQAV